MMYEQQYHKADISNASFLISGGAGFIGSNLVEYLIKYGAGKVRVLDNFSTGKPENLAPFLQHPAFELVEGDIRSFETCQAALEGINYVSHQAALGSVPRSIKDPITTNDVNITGQLHMLTASRDAGVKGFVYAASSSTYGDSKELPKVEEKIGAPLSPYAITKYVNELYANIFSDLYGFHSIGLRYFNVFGPRQDPFGAYAAVIPLFMKALIEGNAPTINGDGEQTRDFTFVENAVQANVLGMLTSPNLDKSTVINIAVGENISLNGLWNELRTLSGKELQPNYGPARQGDVRNSLANIDKARNTIGYDPKFRIKEALGKTFDWYQSTLPKS